MDLSCVGKPGPGGTICPSLEITCADGFDYELWFDPVSGTIVDIFLDPVTGTVITFDGRTDCADPDCVGRLGPAGIDRKSTRLNSSHSAKSRMPSSA